MNKDRAKPAAPETPSYDYDVFISYSSKDKAWVRGELLKRLEGAGLRVFIDYRDFTPGAPSIKGMERGVTKSAKTLLVLTPDYVESEWCELENNMSLSRSPANRDGRRIPLLKAPCEKPLHFAHLTHVDFTEGADVDLGWRQLLTALGKPPEPPQAMQPSREHWNLVHPYAMPPNFTGRVVERKMLKEWLTHDDAHPLLVLRALGGFGKSALTWHWLLHEVDPAQWPCVVWWSFYEGDASFESFVANTVRYLDPNSAPSASPREQLVSLLQALHSRGTLLILDGFERVLRAFGGLNAAYQGDETVSAAGERDCISPLADAFLRNMASLPGMHCKVLITTRLRPASVETRGGILLQGCREAELVQLQPADAVEFFHAQGIRGGRAEIEAACEPYGYHPLSLRLLAGLILGDLQQQGDIAASQRLDVSGDLVQRQHHVLEQAYASLDPARQKLLSRIACFRSPVKFDALRSLADTESAESDVRAVGGDGGQREKQGSLDANLRDLVASGLLHRDFATDRFDLHPIVRRYAYDRLAAPDRVGTHVRLRDYFAAVPEPDKLNSLGDLAEVIELYHHTTRAGQYEDAFMLFSDRLDIAISHQFCAYQLGIDLLGALFPDGEADRPRLEEERDQAWTLNKLADFYGCNGEPGLAISLFGRQIEIDEMQQNMENVAGGLRAMSVEQVCIGALRASEANRLRALRLFQKIEDKVLEAITRSGLGYLLACRGVLVESEKEGSIALEILGDDPFDGSNALEIAWRYFGWSELLRLRCATVGDNSKFEIPALTTATASAHRALELYEERELRIGRPSPADFVDVYGLLGAAYRMASEFDKAERHLHEALERCRRINKVESEADILIDLASLRMATAAPDEAHRLAEEALVITERSGYVLQGADAHLVLAQLAKDRGDAKELRHHATEALRLATCDGPPDYTYKAAYDEATALLR